ncbi:MAG TPA: ATP phosphoribosyltransferase [Limnochordia bacterium]
MPRRDELTMAVPKDRLLEPFAERLSARGIDCTPLLTSSRRLFVKDPKSRLSFILTRSADVATFVEHGAADLGVIGENVLLEQGKRVAVLADLGFGRCSLVVAVPDGSPIRTVQDFDFNSRVATKYPNITARYFGEHGIQVEVVPLSGSVELAPLVGLADAIVDVTETGRTLAENGLRKIATIAESSARLVANTVSLRVHFARIHALAEALKAT